MEERADVAPEIDLTIENWDTLFGESGIVNTPIGGERKLEAPIAYPVPRVCYGDKNGKRIFKKSGRIYFGLYCLVRSHVDCIIFAVLSNWFKKHL